MKLTHAYILLPDEAEGRSPALDQGEGGGLTEDQSSLGPGLTPWWALWQRLHTAMLQEKACT